MQLALSDERDLNPPKVGALRLLLSVLDLLFLYAVPEGWEHGVAFLLDELASRELLPFSLVLAARPVHFFHLAHINDLAYFELALAHDIDVVAVKALPADNLAPLVGHFLDVQIQVPDDRVRKHVEKRELL